MVPCASSSCLTTYIHTHTTTVIAEGGLHAHPPTAPWTLTCAAQFHAVDSSQGGLAEFEQLLSTALPAPPRLPARFQVGGAALRSHPSDGDRSARTPEEGWGGLG